MLALAAVEEKSLLNMGTAWGAPVTASSSSSDHGGLVLPSHGSSSFKSDSAAKHQNKFSFVKTAARSLSPFKDFSFKTSWLQGSRQRRLERPADHASEEKGARGGSKESTASVATSRSGSLTGSSSWGQNFDFSRLTTACSMTEAGEQVVLVPGGGTGTSSGKVFTSVALAQLQDKLGFPGNSTSPSSSSGAASGANFGGRHQPRRWCLTLQDRRKGSGSRGVLAAQPAHLPQQVVEDDGLPFDLDDDHDLPTAEDAERSVCFANRRELKLHSRRAAVREEARERSSRNVNISTTSQLSSLACLNGLVGRPAGEVSRAALVQFAGKELPRAERRDVRDKCDRQEKERGQARGAGRQSGSEQSGVA
eukprot:g894.t1